MEPDNSERFPINSNHPMWKEQQPAAESVKPCLFCNNKESHPVVQDLQEGGWWVICYPCGVSTKWDTKSEAVAKWNNAWAHRKIAELEKSLAKWFYETQHIEKYKSDKIIQELERRNVELESHRKECSGQFNALFEEKQDLERQLKEAKEENEIAYQKNGRSLNAWMDEKGKRESLEQQVRELREKLNMKNCPHCGGMVGDQMKHICHSA